MNNDYHHALVAMYVNEAITEKQLKEAFLAEGILICYHRTVKFNFQRSRQYWDAKKLRFDDMMDENDDFPTKMHTKMLWCDGFKRTHNPECPESFMAYGELIYTGRYDEEGYEIDSEDTGYYELPSCEEALKQAEDEGWRVIDGQVYCPVCQKEMEYEKI